MPSVCNSLHKDKIFAGGTQFRIFLDYVNNSHLFQPSLLTRKDVFCKVLNYQTFTVSELNINSLVSFFSRLHLSDLFLLPDKERISLNPAYSRELSRIFKNHSFDFVQTNSFPCSTHLVGLKCKKKFNIPWVAQFYDPWVNNPQRKFKFKKFKELDSKLERLVALNADVIIHTNQQIIDNWIARYGDIVRGKIFLLPLINNYEILNYTESSAQNNIENKIIISHIGGLDDKRNIFGFIKAVELAVSKEREILNRLEIRFVGPIGPNNLQMIKESKNESIFNLVGYVQPANVAIYYQTSDAFIVIDSIVEENLCFPSKLLDYFLWKKPIIGISSKISCTYDYLKDSGHNVFEHNDARGMSDYMIQLLIKNKTASFDENFYKKFDGDCLINQYYNIVNNLV